MSENRDFIQLIKNRRSIRKWKKQKIPENVIREIIDCGLSAPSAYGAYPWELVIIDDSSIIDKLLSERRQLKKPPYDINSSRYIDRLGKEKYEKVSPPPLLIVIAGDKKKCFNDVPGLIASLSCCGENMLLACHALGLGAVWLYVADEEMPETEQSVKDILKIPKDISVLSMIAIGYPNEIPMKKASLQFKVHKNEW